MVRTTRWSLFIQDLLLHHSLGLYWDPNFAACREVGRWNVPDVFLEQRRTLADYARSR